VPGICEAAITELKLVRGEVLEPLVLSSWAQVLDYCRASMGFASKEQFRMLFSMSSFSFLIKALSSASLTRPSRVLHPSFLF